MSERIPFVQVDTSGAPALDGVADGDTLVGTEEGLLIAGKDGTNKAQFIKTDADGAVAISDNAGSLTVDDGSGSLTVDGSVSITGTPTVTVSNFPATQPVSGTVSVSNLPATQAVSATALPLPAGASTAAKQPAVGAAGTPSVDVLTVQGTTSMTALKVDGSAVTQPVSGSVGVSNFPATQPVSGTVGVSNFPATQPVSVTGLPLPTGASTAAKQPAVGTAGSAASDVLTVQGITSMTALKVDGSAVTQPVSGSVGVSNFPATQPVSGTVGVSNFPATQAVSAAALPLPAGASTAAKQPAVGAAGSASADVLTVQGITSMTALKVDGSAVTQPVSGSVGVTAASLPLPTGASTAAKQPAVGTAGSAASDVLTVQGITSMTALKVDGSAVTQPVSGSVGVTAASLPLPAGAATAAKQPAVGTAGSAASDVLTVQGIASMTALKVDGSAVTQPVSGSVGVSNFPATQTVSGTVSVSNFPATQPVSAAALPLPTGAATSAAQTTGNSALSSIDTKVTGVALDTTLVGGTQKAIVRGGAKGSTAAADVTSLPTGTNHQALAVAVVDASGNQITTFGSGSVSVSNFPATQAVSATALPLPTGASTSAKQPALGAAGSAAVDVLTVQGIASMTALKVDGSTVTQPVSGSVGVSNFPATQPVSAAALPLPTGAATSVKQPVLGVAGTPSADVLTVQGATSMTALKVDGSAVTQPVSGSVGVSNFPATQPVSAVSLPLPSGAATETTLGTRLADATFTGRINTLGQKTAVASTPVVLASDQSTLSVTTAVSDTVSGPTSLAALNNTVVVAMAGKQSCSVQLAAGTFAGTIVAEHSVDGGSTYQATYFVDPTTEARNPYVIFTNPNPAGAQGIMVAPGVTNVRLRVSAFTSGSLSGTLRATSIPQNTSKLETAPTGTPTPLNAVLIGGTDGTNLTAVVIKAASTAAVAADKALVVAISPNNAVAVTSASLPLPTGAATSAAQTTGNSSLSSIDTKVTGLSLDATLTGNNQRTRLTDGTNLAAVKAASTSPVAADPALVVALSPNSAVLDSVKAQVSFSAVGTSTIPIVAGQSYSVLRIQLSGSVAEFEFPVEGSVNNTTWYSIKGFANGVPVGATFNNPGTFTYLIAGFSYLRFNCQYVSGTVVVDYTLSKATTPYSSRSIVDATNGYTATVKGGGSSPAGGDSALVVAVSPNSGMALDATLTSNNQRTRLTDGTNLAAIKAASTPAVATDPALVVALASPPAATLTNVSTSTTSAQLLAADLTRRAATIANDATAILYVKFGVTASATSYTVALAPAVGGVPSYYEVHRNYTGRIDAVLASGTGTARVTALT